MATNSYSLLFDGASNRATIPATSNGPTTKNMSEFTLMAWVKPDAGNSQYDRLWVERQGTGAGIRLAMTPMDGRIRFEYSPKDGHTDTNYDYKYNWDDNWHHVAFAVRMSDTDSHYEMYLDATKVAEGQLVIPSNVDRSGPNPTDPPIVSNTWPSGGKIYLGQASFHTSGGDVFSADRYWKGNVDDILLLNASVNEGDLQAYFASYDIWDMGDSAMFSYWRFDDPTLPTSTDTTVVDVDNPTWTMTLTSGAMWDIDRPYIGNGNTDTTNPSTPGSPSTTSITNDGFTANWTASTDDVYVQYYEVQLAQVSDFSVVITTYNNGRLLTKKIQGLNPNSQYYWRVRALDARANPSSWAATQSPITLTEGDVTPPNSPTTLAAPLINLSFASFRVTWTASTSPDADGYKLDVSTSPLFNTFVSEFRNRDVDAVGLFDVYGLKSLTNYYVRLRTYDTSGNESDNSVTLAVQTIDMPDSSAPLPIEMLNATSITSKKATLNWEEGYDDVGVVTYHLDISSNDTFSSYMTINSVVYADYNVGNVTSFPLDMLTPDTLYYYRVRALDGAGNESENTDPIGFRTELSSLDEGGFISTIHYPHDDAHVKSGTSTTNYGTLTELEVIGNGTTATSLALMEFDLTNQLGTFVNAMLRLYVSDASSNSVTIKVDNVTFDETTVTYATKPTVTSSSLTFIPLLVDDWVEIDISSLILDGAVQYTVQLSMTANDTAKFHSKEGLFPPVLTVESDPSTLTEVDKDLLFTDYQGLMTNFIKNTNAKVNTTFWTGIGSPTGVITGVTDGVSGLPAFNVATTSGASGQGMRYANNDIPAVVGDTWFFHLRARVLTGTPTITVRVSEYSSGGSLLTSVTTSLVATTAFQEKVYSYTLTQATVAFVTIGVETATATAVNLRVDQIMAIGSHLFQIDAVPFFDGDSDGALWVATVNNSRSTIPAAILKAQSNYTGDGDLDNSVEPFFRRRRETDWIYVDQIKLKQFTQDRSLHRVETYFGPAYGPYNMVTNPGFEIDLVGWTLLNPNGNASMSRDLDQYVRANEYSSSGASVQLVWGTGAGSGMFSDTYAAAASVRYNSSANIFMPVGAITELRIQFLNAAGSVIGTSPTEIGVNQIVGTNDWYTFHIDALSPASTTGVRVLFFSVGSVAGHANFDNNILNSVTLADHYNPYRDGDSPDGMWYGVPHKSPSGIRILPDTDYAFKHRYADPDGILNALEDGYYHLNEAHTTEKLSDDVTTLTGLDLTPFNTSIDVRATYDGDDNENMVATIRWKRSDLTSYTSVPVTYDRTNKIVGANILDLKPGTDYTVRFVASDVDGIYGGTGSGNDTFSDTTTTTTDFNSSEGKSLITFNGYVLMGRHDGTIGVDQHDAFGFPNRRLQVEDLPRNHGAIELQNLWGKRQIKMSGFVSGDTRAELEDNKNALKRALAPKKQRLVIDTLSNLRRYYIATVENLDIPEKGGENLRHLLWDATFTCADPFAYDAQQSAIPEFTANDASEIAIFNDGDIQAEPIITLRTTNSRAVTVTITNTVTGERITPQTTILNNDRLVIDTTKFSVTKNGIEVDYAGGFLHLTAGSNNLKFELISVLSSPSVKCTVGWVNKYI